MSLAKALVERELIRLGYKDIGHWARVRCQEAKKHQASCPSLSDLADELTIIFDVPFSKWTVKRWLDEDEGSNGGSIEQRQSA